MENHITATIQLRDDVAMPLFGLGTYQAAEGEEARAAVRAALDAGYRHIDTAAAYGNEADVGRAIRDSDVDPSEIFVTTKLWNDDQGYDQALRAFDRSLDRLGLDRVDLYLIHWPLPGKRLDSWRALERIRDEGRARAIGVSNFMVRHLRELLDHSDAVPAVNQFELHPFNGRSRRDVIDFCRKHHIAVEGYSPLVKAERLDDPTLADIAARHGKSTAQILIAWALHHRFVTIPKSASTERIRANADVFDIALSDDDVARIDALDEDYITSWDPREVD